MYFETHFTIGYKVATAVENHWNLDLFQDHGKNNWISSKVLEICKYKKKMEKSLNCGSVTHEKTLNSERDSIAQLHEYICYILYMYIIYWYTIQQSK